MRARYSLLALGLSLSLLTGCEWFTANSGLGGDEASSSSMAAVMAVQYEGQIEKTGVNELVSTDHYLRLVNGDVVALESELISLDAYIDAQVIVNGFEEESPEGYPIVSVTRVESLEEELPSLVASSSSLASSSVQTSSSSQAASSVAASSARASSKAPVAPPPVAPSSVQASSVAPAAASSAASSNDPNAKAALMAKATVSESTFTQGYCTTHIGFCVPVHKNWYYVSFGANTDALWHVEVGPTEIENVGDGVIVIELLPGAASQDGEVTVSGETVTGIRAWTGGRHFEIRGPVAVRAAVEFMTQGLVTSEPEATP